MKKKLNKIVLSVLVVVLGGWLGGCNFTNVDPQKPFIVKEIRTYTDSVAYYDITVDELFNTRIVITDAINKYNVGDTLIFIKRQ